MLFTCSIVFYSTCTSCSFIFSEADNSIKVTPNIYLSRESKLLERISKGEGPKDYMFLLGYAGWGPGQLEAELMDNSWLTVPGDMHVLFDTPDDLKWKHAARRYGINISIFSDIVGNA
jgi:putative transcriptional regulator